MNTLRKTLLTLALSLLLLLLPSAHAEADAVSYALIGKDAVLLSDSYTPVTSLPEGYFAAIIADLGNGYVEVSYLDITGYIEGSKLEPVDYEPVSKYCEVGSLTLSNDGHEVNVRSSPDHTASNVVAAFKSDEKLFYYGSIPGSAQVPAIGDKWYFVRYYDQSGTVRRGYVYSLYADAVPFPQNTIEAVKQEDASSDVERTEPESFILPVDKEAVIIIALCVPVVIIAFLLFHERKT